ASTNDQILRDAESKQLETIRGDGDANSSGAFHYSIPIDLPPGRRGVAPKLELDYDSHRGNGFAGVGWSLTGISAISRMNWGSGINYLISPEDTYVFLPGGWGEGPSPSARLVRLRDAVSGNPPRYHTARDTMAEYRPMGSCGGGPCYWVMRDGKGLTYYYGN